MKRSPRIFDAVAGWLMYPHIIRLRGPWEWQAVDGTPHERGKLKFPADWDAALGHRAAATLLLRRFFHCPTGLDPHERLWLVVETTGRRARVSLNGVALGESNASSSHVDDDITSIVQTRNELEVRVEAGTAEPPLGEVRLEIRTTFLADGAPCGGDSTG